MRDPFPLARMSGIIAMANTDRFYTLRDVATKVLPSLCTACVDPEKDVRDEAFKTIKFFMQKLEKVSEHPEQALEMEKDVTSCALELKNETSWTSWAMTGLSAKMTGYKNKNQQPSVALNTQPLGPPPSLVVNTSSSSTTDKASPKGQSSTVNTSSTSSKSPKTQEASVSSKNTTENTNKIQNTATGWNLDEDEWKDLDDDGDQMEPLEMNNSMSYLNQASKNSEVKSTSNNNDWSSWTNSFEDDKNTQFASSGDMGKPKSKANSNSQSQLPLASSYNWSTNQNAFSVDPAKSEEDMFSSLVKDINISNKKASPSSKAPAASITTNTATVSGWSNDWSDFTEDTHKGANVKRQERQQRNAEKQADNDNKIKQSKPLKLGQKKDPIF